jgi:hypothetical protein
MTHHHTTVGLASVRKRVDRFVITSSSMTVGWTDNGFIEVLDLDVSNEELGSVVSAALAATRISVPPPQPREWDEIRSAVLQAGGVRSWAAMERKTKMVQIELMRDGTLIVHPTKSHGTAYGPFDAEDELLSQPSHADLGRAISDALTRSS